MAKIPIITDTHHGARNDSLLFNDYFNTFFEKQFIPYLLENNIKDIIHGGDVFDRRKYVNFNILDQVRSKIFDVFVKNNINVHIALGNHDTYWKNTNIVNSPMMLLTGYKNIHIMGQTTHKTIQGLDICFVPWICQDNLDHTMKSLAKSKAKVCVGHLELNGFEVIRGVYHEHGTDPELFKKFDRVLSGHFHTKQTRGNIDYLGCPYDITFSDMPDIKGFHVLDTENLDLEFIPNPNKMFHKVLYDDKDKKFQTLMNVDFSRYTQTYVKIVVINKTNHYWFDKFLDALSNANPADIKIIEDVGITLTDEDTIVDLAEDTMTVLDKYVDSTQIESDKDKLKKKLKELYIEAQNVEL